MPSYDWRENLHYQSKYANRRQSEETRAGTMTPKKRAAYDKTRRTAAEYGGDKDTPKRKKKKKKGVISHAKEAGSALGSLFRFLRPGGDAMKESLKGVKKAEETMRKGGGY